MGTPADPPKDRRQARTAPARRQAATGRRPPPAAAAGEPLRFPQAPGSARRRLQRDQAGPSGWAERPERLAGADRKQERGQQDGGARAPPDRRDHRRRVADRDGASDEPRRRPSGRVGEHQLRKGPRCRYTRCAATQATAGTPTWAKLPKNQVRPVAVSSGPVRLSGRRVEATSPQPMKVQPTVRSGIVARTVPSEPNPLGGKTDRDAGRPDQGKPPHRLS
jgi:hypothetical protein